MTGPGWFEVELANRLGTLAAGGVDQAAAVTATQAALTDNGGGTADGTVAALTVPTTLTDSTGDSGTHNDTLADGVTIGAALTDSTGGTPGDTLAAIAAAGTYADDDDAIKNAIASLAAKVNTLRTDSLTHNQNISDVGQKVIELVTWAGVVQDNFKEVTTELDAARVDIAAIIASLQAAGLMA